MLGGFVFASRGEDLVSLGESGDHAPQSAEDGEDDASRHGGSHEGVAVYEGQDESDQDARDEVGHDGPEARQDQATDDRSDPLLGEAGERAHREDKADALVRWKDGMANDVQAERSDPDDHPETLVVPMRRQEALERKAEDEAGSEVGVDESEHAVLQVRVAGCEKTTNGEL